MPYASHTDEGPLRDPKFAALAVKMRASAQETSHYVTLGVEDAAPDAVVKAAYKQRALELHPDKGGDVGKFDALRRAYVVLNDPKLREQYDEDLAKQRAKVVEGGPRGEAAPAKVRVKTAPTPGSKRSLVGGNTLWTSPNAFLRAIEDQATEEQKAERLFQNYKALDKGAGKEKLRKWKKKMLVKDQQAMKEVAKKHTEEARLKAQKWLKG